MSSKRRELEIKQLFKNKASLLTCSQNGSERKFSNRFQVYIENICFNSFEIWKKIVFINFSVYLGSTTKKNKKLKIVQCFDELCLDKLNDFDDFTKNFPFIIGNSKFVKLHHFPSRKKNALNFFFQNYRHLKSQSNVLFEILEKIFSLL